MDEFLRDATMLVGRYADPRDTYPDHPREFHSTYVSSRFPSPLLSRINPRRGETKREGMTRAENPNVLIVVVWEMLN